MPPRAAPVRLRAYRPSDHRAVVRLWRASGLSISPSDRPAEIERARQRDPQLFVVAVAGDRLVGAVLGRFDGRRGWVNHLAVDAAFRGQHLGIRLMREVERQLAALGCAKVNLHVLSSNRAVVGFYETLGYEVSDMLFLQKWLRRGPLRGRLAPRPATTRRRA